MLYFDPNFSKIRSDTINNTPALVTIKTFLITGLVWGEFTVTGGFSHKGPVMRIYDFLFVGPNKLLDKQSRYQ